jgi:hypothetical protein
MIIWREAPKKDFLNDPKTVFGKGPLAKVAVSTFPDIY